MKRIRIETVDGHRHLINLTEGEAELFEHNMELGTDNFINLNGRVFNISNITMFEITDLEETND